MSLGGDPATLSARWRRALTASAAAGRVDRLPTTVVSLLLETGRWSAEDALAQTRLPSGARPPRLFAALAGHLSLAQIDLLLDEVLALPSAALQACAPGVSALLRRAAALAGPAHALARFERLPALLGAAAAPGAAALAATLDDHGVALSAVLAHARAHAPGLSGGLGAETLLDLLPTAPPALREALVAEALAQLEELDFPVTPAQWRKIGAVDPERPLRAALAESSSYASAWRFAAASWSLRGVARRGALRRWLDAATRLVGEGFGLRGNVIPTPLPADLLDETRALLRERAGELERAYVLASLTEGHPELLDEASAAIEAIPPVDRAFAWLALAPRLGGKDLARRADEAVEIFRHNPRALPGLEGAALFNTQRAWCGWDAETHPVDEWRARAIALLEEPARGRALTALLASARCREDQAAACRALAHLAAALPEPRRAALLAACEPLAGSLDPADHAHLELALAASGPLPAALARGLRARDDLQPELLARLVARAPEADRLRHELLEDRVFGATRGAWERWGAALLAGAPLPLVDLAWRATADLVDLADRAAARAVVAVHLPAERHAAALATIAADVTGSDLLSQKSGAFALSRLMAAVDPAALDALKGRPKLGALRREALAQARRTATAGSDDPAAPIADVLGRPLTTSARLLEATAGLPPLLDLVGGPGLIEAWAEAILVTFDADADAEPPAR